MVTKTGILITIGVAILARHFYITVYGTGAQHGPSPIVETRSGQVQGQTSLSRDGRTFYEYMGIPYAKPPLGSLRYESPQKAEKWDGILQTTKYGSECAQLNLFAGGTKTGSEDCLFLNVFTPEVKPKDGKLKPTLVFIHGGAFGFGSANMYRPDYIMDEDVVLVTINYRLGALGFLNTGDGIVRGNMGLKDQTMALKWVNENIAKFGGDPGQVTVFGESAGGASVHYQLLSPMSKGLFHKAIAQSGTVLAGWAFKQEPLKQAKKYASGLNCPTDSTKEMVTCLKSATTAELLEGHKESVGTLIDPITMFGPSVEVLKDEQTFISEHPMEIIRKGKAHRLPWMTGYNSHEGLLSAPTIVRDEAVLKRFEEEFNKVMPNFIHFDRTGLSEAKVDSIMSKVRDFYFGPGNRIDSSEKIENYTNVMTDYLWSLPLQDAVIAQSEFSPIYTYYYSYKGDFTLTRILLAVQGKYPLIAEVIMHKLTEWFKKTILGKEIIHHGACHGDELALLFKMNGLHEISRDHEDYKMSKELVKLWTSFAKDDKQLKFKGQVWQPLEKPVKSIKYFQIDETAKTIDQPDPDRAQLWRNLLGTKPTK